MAIKITSATLVFDDFDGLMKALAKIESSGQTGIRENINGTTLTLFTQTDLSPLLPLLGTDTAE